MRDNKLTYLILTTFLGVLCTGCYTYFSGDINILLNATFAVIGASLGHACHTAIAIIINKMPNQGEVSKSTFFEKVFDSEIGQFFCCYFGIYLYIGIMVSAELEYIELESIFSLLPDTLPVGLSGFLFFVTTCFSGFIIVGAIHFICRAYFWVSFCARSKIFR